MARFLLAQLHLDSLIGKRAPKAVRTALKKLPKGSDAYDRAYDEAMERIGGQVADSKELARQVLSWITLTQRPLTIEEIQHALAVEIGEPEIDEENIPEVEDIVSVCAGLAIVDEESNIIRLVHYTTQEYFERTQMSWFPNAQRDIAMTCVTYLSLDCFETGFCPTDEELEERLQLNPLYDYAARNWGHHTRAASADGEKLILNLLGSKAKVAGCSQAMMASKLYWADSGYSQGVPKQMGGIHLAAYLGLKQAMTTLLKNKHDLDSKNTHGRAPLSYTAEYGHEAVAKLLLWKGTELEATDLSGWTPLFWAVESGQEAIVKLLLEQGAELKVEDEYGRTPLFLAIEGGQETIVKLLLEQGAELEVKDRFRRTPLLLAVQSRQEAIVKLLLEQGAELEVKDEYDRTPLLLAVDSGQEAIVKLLLEQGAELEVKNRLGETPLFGPVVSGQEAIVKLLLEQGAELKVKNRLGETPLFWAIRNGHDAIVKLLGS